MFSCRKGGEMNTPLSASFFCRLVAACVLATSASAYAEQDAPSRQPLKGCEWVKIADTTVGLSAWVQKCDFGFRRIDLFFKEKKLFVRYSDGGDPWPVIEVFDLLPKETFEAGLKRIFNGHTEKSVAKRCVLADYPGVKPPAGSGAKRFTFIPNAAYQKELDAKASPDEVPEPPCGEMGEMPDGVQYFEAWPEGKARKVLLVIEGQDEPLFDEKTLQLIQPR
jgi:hypothetical protein